MKLNQLFSLAQMLCIATLVINFGTLASAQTTQTVTVNPVSNSLKKIGFRSLEWKTFHSHDNKEAQETISTLTKLGCEVTSENHGDHMDVRYRCADWKSLDLATDQLVNQWSTWFAAKGLETVVVNPPANTQKETVKFRMPQPKTVHLHDPKAAAQILNTLKLIGCQVNSKDHNGHIDLTFNCPEWAVIEVPSKEFGDVWKKWLGDSGFEIQ